MYDLSACKFAPFSAFKMNEFLSCKYKFFLRYIEKEKPIEVFGSSLEKGRFIHHALEFYPDKPTPFKFSMLSESEQNEAFHSLKKIIGSDKIKRLLSYPKDSLEREFSFKIYDDWSLEKTETNKVLIKGDIDYYNRETNRIIDWKTGKIYPDKSVLQIKLYALYGILKSNQDFEASYYYVEHNEMYSEEYKADDLDNIKKYFSDIINTIESEKTFDKKINRLCEWCSYKHICKPFTMNIKGETHGKEMGSIST